MRVMCLCGHPKEDHGDYRKECQCLEFCAKPPAAEPEWLSKPDGDGWWAAIWPNQKPEAVYVELEKNKYTQILGQDRYFSGIAQGVKWQRIKMPTPPPAPLPRERQVTLTAKVFVDHRGFWNADASVPGHQFGSKIGKTRDEVVQWVRDTYSIEPVVEGEE